MKTKIFSVLAVLAILIMSLPGAVMAVAPDATVGLTTTVVGYPPVTYSLWDSANGNSGGISGNALTSIDFGSVNVGSTSEHKFFIRNDGTSPLSIEIDATGSMYMNRMQLSFDESTWYDYNTSLGWRTLTPVLGAHTATVGDPQSVFVRVNPIYADIGTPTGTLTFYATEGSW